MLYEVITSLESDSPAAIPMNPTTTELSTCPSPHRKVMSIVLLMVQPRASPVITSYSIHYTKLYEGLAIQFLGL